MAVRGMSRGGLTAAVVLALLAATGCEPGLQAEDQTAAGTQTTATTADASRSVPDPDEDESSTAASTSAQSSTGPSTTAAAPTTHDPGWVATENAHEGVTGWRSDADSLAGEMELAGYADAESILPGEPVVLRVTSAGERWTVRALRLGYYEGRGAREVWASDVQAGQEQDPPTTTDDGMVVAGWEPSLTVDTTGWPEGSYLLQLSGESSGHRAFVPLTLRSASTQGRLVILTATSTYQAYNTWGGASTYDGPDGSFATRARRVSFDRPYDRDGARVPLQYEFGPIHLAEALGIDLAYVSSHDVDSRPGLLEGARGIVSLGHDEYWSAPMRTAVEAARDSGTNLAFLGANAAYWRVRYEDGGRTMVATKSAAEDPGQGEETTDLWRRGPGAVPENSLTGMLYECFPAQGPLVVHDPDFFLFQGTGAASGTAYPGLVGTEVDRAYPIEGTPDTLRVVAHSPVQCGDVGPTHADVTYYWNDAGAGVFAVGTMAWAKAVHQPVGALGIDETAHEFAEQVTSNLFTRMAVGPMAEQEDARPTGNLAELAVPTTTSTGTGMGYELP